MRQDVRSALRTLRHSPGFTSMVVLSLALGIGANTAIFSLIDAVLLKMLPVREPGQLFLVESAGARGRSNAVVSYPLFGRLREALGGRAELAALTEPARFNAGIGTGTLEPAYGQLVSGEYLQMEYAHSLDLRVAGDPRAVASEIRQAIAGVAPNLPVEDVAPLAEFLSRTFSQERLIARLTGFFSLLALALACVGLYGVMSYAVTRRTPELGIRMAVGAQRGGVLWLVLREALVLAGIGLGLGLPLTLAAARGLASQLFGLQPSDPVTLGGALAVMILVAALAGYLPARRAARVDPMVALRYE